MKANPLVMSAICLALLGSGCKKPSVEELRGKAAIERYGCAACHTIPGINKAYGLVGPSLEKMGLRNYIGGVATNNPDNMARWIEDPQALSPRTAMPNLHVSHSDARAMADYLSTLH